MAVLHPRARRTGLSIRTRLSLTFAALLVSTVLGMFVAYSITVRVMNGANVPVLERVTTLTVVGVAMLGAAATWLIVGWMLRPLQRLSTIARGVDENSLSTRLNLRGVDDEIRSLADTIDGLLERLESAFSSRSLFAANASHELRTPLATMKTILQVAQRSEIDVATRETYSRLLTTVESMTATTTALLGLAQVRESAAEEEFDLAECVKSALADNRADMARRGLVLTVDLAPALIAGNPRLVENLAANLVRNAVVHNIDRGWVGVSVSSDRESRAVLLIENSGDVVPADRIPLLTEPFYRARLRTSGGTGLGLALVQAIADRHGAEFSIRPRTPNGLVTSTTFPKLPPAQSAEHQTPPR